MPCLNIRRATVAGRPEAQPSGRSEQIMRRAFVLTGVVSAAFLGVTACVPAPVRPARGRRSAAAAAPAPPVQLGDERDRAGHEGLGETAGATGVIGPASGSGVGASTSSRAGSTTSTRPATSSARSRPPTAWSRWPTAATSWSPRTGRSRSSRHPAGVGAPAPARCPSEPVASPTTSCRRRGPRTSAASGRSRCGATASAWAASCAPSVMAATSSPSSPRSAMDNGGPAHRSPAG